MINNEVLAMKAQYNDAYRIKGGYDSEIDFRVACEMFQTGHGTIEQVRDAFNKMGVIVCGYGYGPKPLWMVHGFRSIKISY